MENEKRLIDANELTETLSSLIVFFNGLRFGKTALYKYAEDYQKEVLRLVDEAPTVDAVSRGVHDQVRWERDVVIGQLESYGISLGEKADVAKVVHGHWVASGCGFDCCSECRKVYADGYLTAMGIKPRTQFNYCPNCGAKMDGDGNE